MKFPKDENGSLLQEMHDAGIDLSQPLDVEFFTLFKTKKNAEAMIAEVIASDASIKTILEQNEIHDDWDLCCIINMIPAHHQITLREAFFEKLAEKHHGDGDGWGVTQEE